VERDRLHGGALEGHARVAPLGSSEREHLLGKVDADHLGSAALREMARELSSAALQGEDAAASDLGEQRQEARILERLRPASAEPLQLRIAGEEGRSIVDVSVVADRWP
jgi:hypothetical protein